MKLIKKISLGISSVAMMAAATSAYSHTIISRSIMSDDAGYSSVMTTHGCGATLPGPTPVVATSTVLPTINPIVKRSDTGAAVNLGDFFSKASGHSPTSPQVPLDNLKGMFALIQSKDVFTQNVEQNDSPGAGGNVIGWVGTRGVLGQNLYDEIPFRVSAINFNQNTCAKELRITFASADICDIHGWDAPRTGPVTPGTNLWIDNTYLDFHGAHIENGAATVVLTVKRDTAKKPYPSNCVGAGGSDPLYNITVQPSQADVEKLQFPGWGPDADPAYFY